MFFNKCKQATTLIFCIISLFVCILSMVASLYIYTHKPGPLVNPKTVIIPKGYSTKQIALMLAREQVIDHPYIWGVIVKILDTKNIKAGEYFFDARVTPADVIDKIKNGKVVIHKLTIPEGLTNQEIYLKLIENEFLTGNIEQEYTEGYLFPDTYYFIFGDLRQDLIDKMRQKMKDTLTSLWEQRSAGLPYKTIEEALTLASIIEKEASNDEEKKRIAAVFINRMNKNMKLQADPTVIYAITNGKFPLNRLLSKIDLLYQSQYNTYLNYGLPPTPIANPGYASIEAALKPMVSDELYFVLNGEGNHSFASSLEQHTKNVLEYRKRQKIEDN